MEYVKRERISEPGTHTVTIIEVENTQTFKDKKPMLRIIFERDDKKSLQSTFTRFKKDGTINTFASEILAGLKTTVGLFADTPAQELIGKKLKIVAEWGNETTDKEGRLVRYMQIVNYLPLSAPHIERTVGEDTINW